jgi:hypothetical protein
MKLRQASYFRFPGAAPAKRAGALAVVQQAYICGAYPPRRQLVESLGLRVSRSRAVRICARHAIGAASTQDWKRRWSI